MQCYIDEWRGAHQLPAEYEGLPSSKEILRQISRGIHHFHQNNISKIEHRDVKPANILVSTGLDPTMKLADFEFCCLVSDDINNYSLPVGTGTEGYMAPELYERNHEHELTPFAIDIFAAGCVFCLTLTGGKQHPFGKARNIIINNIRSGIFDFSDYDWRCDQLFYQLMQSMLDAVPSNRPTSAEVLGSPFLNELLEFCEITEDWQAEGKIQHFGELVANESIDVNVRNANGRTPLMLICERNQTTTLREYLQTLLARNSEEINAKDENGNCALIFLCENYSHDDLIEILKLLIEFGIDITAVDDGSQLNALLTLCIGYAHLNLIDIVRLLIECGIDVTATDDQGLNALHQVCRHYKGENLIDIVRLLVVKGINVNAITNEENQWSALHLLCCFNTARDDLIQIVRLL